MPDIEEIEERMHAIMVNMALLDKIKAQSQHIKGLENDLDAVLSVVARMERYLDRYAGGEGNFELWAMGYDHQLYDDMLGLPARKETS